MGTTTGMATAMAITTDMWGMATTTTAIRTAGGAG